MDIFGRTRAPLIAAIACVTMWASGINDLLAGPIAQPAGLTAAIPVPEPFSIIKSNVFAGPLKDKWSDLARKLDDERVQLALCDGDRERCASPAANPRGCGGTSPLSVPSGRPSLQPTSPIGRAATSSPTAVTVEVSS